MLRRLRGSLAIVALLLGTARSQADDLSDDIYGSGSGESDDGVGIGGVETCTDRRLLDGGGVATEASCRCASECHSCEIERTLTGGVSTCTMCRSAQVLLGGACLSRELCAISGGVVNGRGNYGLWCSLTAAPTESPTPPPTAPPTVAPTPLPTEGTTVPTTTVPPVMCDSGLTDEEPAQPCSCGVGCTSCVAPICTVANCVLSTPCDVCEEGSALNVDGECVHPDECPNGATGTVCDLRLPRCHFAVDPPFCRTEFSSDECGNVAILSSMCPVLCDTCPATGSPSHSAPSTTPTAFQSDAPSPAPTAASGAPTPEPTTTTPTRAPNSPPTTGTPTPPPTPAPQTPTPTTVEPSSGPTRARTQCLGDPDPEAFCGRLSSQDCGSGGVADHCPIMCDSCPTTGSPSAAPSPAPSPSPTTGTPTSTEPPTPTSFAPSTPDPTGAPTPVPTGAPTVSLCYNGQVMHRGSAEAMECQCPTDCVVCLNTWGSGAGGCIECAGSTALTAEGRCDLSGSCTGAVYTTADHGQICDAGLCSNRCEFVAGIGACKDANTPTPCSFFSPDEASCVANAARCEFSSAHGCIARDGPTPGGASGVCVENRNADDCRDAPGTDCAWDIPSARCSNVPCASVIGRNSCSGVCNFDDELVLCHDTDEPIACDRLWMESRCAAAEERCQWHAVSGAGNSFCGWLPSTLPCASFVDDDCPLSRCMVEAVTGLCSTPSLNTPCDEYTTEATCPTQQTEYLYSTVGETPICRRLSPSGSCGDDFHELPITPTTDRVCAANTACGSGEFEASAPAVDADRVCQQVRQCSEDAGTGEYVGEAEAEGDQNDRPTYMSRPATATTDTECTVMTACDFGEYEIVAPTSTSDRSCAAMTECSFPDQFISQVETATSNRACTDVSVCSANQWQRHPASRFSDRECVDVTICVSGLEYEIVAPEQEGGMGITDRRCAIASVCDDYEFEYRALGPTNDRTCHEITQCPYELASPTTTSDRVCCDPGRRGRRGEGSATEEPTDMPEVTDEPTDMPEVTDEPTDLPLDTSSGSGAEEDDEFTDDVSTPIPTDGPTDDPNGDVSTPVPTDGPTDDPNGDDDNGINEECRLVTTTSTAGTTTPSPTVEGTSPAPEGCAAILCSNNCTGECGWSSRRNVCDEGELTSEHELGLGDCGPSDAPTAAPTPAPTVSICSGTGDPRYHSFDGHVFTVGGVCRRVLLKDCRGEGDFDLDVDDDDASGSGSGSGVDDEDPGGCADRAASDCPDATCQVVNGSCTDVVTTTTTASTTTADPRADLAFEVQVETAEFASGRRSRRGPGGEEEPTAGSTAVYTHSVSIRLPGGQLLVLSQGESKQVHTFDGAPLVAALPSRVAPGVRISELEGASHGAGVQVKLEALGVRVRWNGGITVTILMDSDSPLLGHTCGLCGNSNGARADEVGQYGVTAMHNAWATSTDPASELTPHLGSETCPTETAVATGCTTAAGLLADQHCARLSPIGLNSNSTAVVNQSVAYAPCWDLVDMEPFFDSCRTEYCKNPELACEVFWTFEEHCRAAGASFRRLAPLGSIGCAARPYFAPTMATTTMPTQIPTAMPTPAPTDPVTTTILTTVPAASTTEEATATTDGSDSESGSGVEDENSTTTTAPAVVAQVQFQFLGVSLDELTQLNAEFFNVLLNEHVNQWRGVSDEPFVITLTAGSIIVTVGFYEGGEADRFAAGQAEYPFTFYFSRNDGTNEFIRSVSMETVIEPSTTVATTRPQPRTVSDPVPETTTEVSAVSTTPPPTDPWGAASGGAEADDDETCIAGACGQVFLIVLCAVVGTTVLIIGGCCIWCKRRKTKSRSISAGPDMVIADSAVTEVSAPNNAVSTDKAKAGAAAFDRIVTNECFEIDADEVLAVMTARKTVETITPAKTTDVLSGKKYVRSSSILSFSIGDAAPAMKRSADESTTDEHEVETHTSSI